MTAGEVMVLIGKLRTSEVRMSLCGKRLLAFYDDVKKRIGNGEH